MTKIAINGFGRIGRLVFRAICDQGLLGKEIAANANAVSIIGGGDSVKAVKKAHVADRITFISTGGGASLELLEGKELPGVAALSDASAAQAAA